MARSASDVAEIDEIQKTDYICTSKESERPAPDTLDETLPIQSQIRADKLSVMRTKTYKSNERIVSFRFIQTADMIFGNRENSRKHAKKSCGSG